MPLANIVDVLRKNFRRGADRRFVAGEARIADGPDAVIADHSQALTMIMAEPSAADDSGLQLPKVRGQPVREHSRTHSPIARTVCSLRFPCAFEKSVVNASKAPQPFSRVALTTFLHFLGHLNIPKSDTLGCSYG